MTVRIDVAGLRRAAAAPGMRDAVNAAARRVATNVEAQNIEVEAENGDADEIALPVGVLAITGPNGEAAALVSLTHPSGASVQAKHGVLTKAAASAGLRQGEPGRIG